MDTNKYRELMISILKIKLISYNQSNDRDLEGYDCDEKDEYYDEGYIAGLREAISTLEKSAFLTKEDYNAEVHK